MRTLKTPHRPPVTQPPPPPVDEGLDWGAAGWAGLVGGAAFLLLQTIVLAAFGGGGWSYAVRLPASIALGETVVSGGEAPATIVFLAAAAVHLQLSMIYARVLAGIIHGLRPGKALVVGGLFGATLYLVNYHALSSFFPWFAAARGPSSVAAHLAFGVIAAWVYARVSAKPERRY